MPRISLAERLHRAVSGKAAFEGWNSLPSGLPDINSAVLVPIIPYGAGIKVLFIERPASMKWHAGQIAFPGGSMESCDYGPLQTALRETREELGLRSELIEPLYVMQAERAVTSGFVIYPVVGIVDIPPDPAVLTPNADEVDGLFFVDPFDLPFEPLERSFDYRGSVHSFTEFPLADGKSIWGVTGRIFNLLIDDISEIEEFS